MEVRIYPWVYAVCGGYLLPSAFPRRSGLVPWQVPVEMTSSCFGTLSFAVDKNKLEIT